MHSSILLYDLKLEKKLFKLQSNKDLYIIKTLHFTNSAHQPQNCWMVLILGDEPGLQDKHHEMRQQCLISGLTYIRQQWKTVRGDRKLHWIGSRF